MQKAITEENKKSYFVAIEQKDKPYEEKLEWLTNRWVNEEDSESARIIKPFLFSHAAPFYQSIIADNLDYFKKLYNQEKAKIDTNLCLVTACLSGSQKIAELLLKDLHLDYLTPSCKDTLLGYVSASNNVEWAKKIAKAMAEAGESMPKSVYGEAASDGVIREISAIFKSFEHHTSLHERPLPSSPPAFNLYKETEQTVGRERSNTNTSNDTASPIGSDAEQSEHSPILTPQGYHKKQQIADDKYTDDCNVVAELPNPPTSIKHGI
jgi:hypothetical protein